jgi:hypothetical protein
VSRNISIEDFFCKWNRLVTRRSRSTWHFQILEFYNLYKTSDSKARTTLSLFFQFYVNIYHLQNKLLFYFFFRSSKENKQMTLNSSYTPSFTGNKNCFGYIFDVTSREPAKIYEALFCILSDLRSLDSWTSIKFKMVLFMYIMQVSLSCKIKAKFPPKLRLCN